MQPTPTSGHPLRRPSRLVVSMLALALGLLSAGGLPATPALANQPAPNRGTAQFEVRFLEDMIDHHFMAVQMAQLCLQKAVHPELRTLCQNIISSQSAQIQQMQTWLQQWYGISYQPRMKPGDMRMMERMASLSSEQFEIEFMQMMIKHHQGAIREGEQCLRRAYHPELRSLCQNIISAQSAEIQQMEAWLCQWYGICQGRRRTA